MKMIVNKTACFLGLVCAAVGFSAAGCCGSSLVAAVPTSAIFTVSGSGLEMFITRDSQGPSYPNPCSSATLADWCTSPSVGEVKFDVNPSSTLYRVYVQNLGAVDRTASVRIIRKVVNETQTKAVPAGATVWFWELGTSTVKEK